MKKNIIKNSFSELFAIVKFIPFVICFVITFSSCTKEKVAPKPSTNITSAPQFTLQSLAGTEVKLSDYKNKVVVLYFYGNNSTSGKAAAPKVENMLVTPFATSTDYVVLGLDPLNGPIDSVKAFKAATNVSFPLLLNASGIAAAYNTTNDRIVVIDKTGNIAFSGIQRSTDDLASVKDLVISLIRPVKDGAGNIVNFAPEFTLKSLDGTTVKLSDFSNKVVVLFLFGYNCPSCIYTAPYVESELVAPFVNISNYVILGLDQWDGNSAAVASFKASTKVSFPLLLRASGVATAYNTTYDRLLVINKIGAIVYNDDQASYFDIEAVKLKVDELLNK